MEYAVSFNSDITNEEQKEFNSLREAVEAYSDLIEEYNSLPFLDHNRVREQNGIITLYKIQKRRANKTLLSWRI